MKTQVDLGGVPRPPSGEGWLRPSAMLASPWLVVVFCWPATLLAWYFITLVAGPPGWHDAFLLRYLVALLVVDSALCVVAIRRLTRHARAVLGAAGPVELALARRAWVEALNLPLWTAALIVALIGITVVPATVFFALRGEWSLILVGLLGAAMAGACELTMLFPLVQGSTLPLLRQLKAAHPALRLSDPGVRAPPLRAYFAFGLCSLTVVSGVLVATLIHLRAHPEGLVGAPQTFPELPSIALVVLCLGCMAGGLSLQLGMSMLGPMRRLAETMRRFSGQERGVRAGLLQLGEVGALCESFDDMGAALEQREALLRHSQRFEVMAKVTGGFAHEVSNPLTCVAANLEMTELQVAQLRQGGGAGAGGAAQVLEACAASLADAREATSQMTSLLRDMRAFGRVDAGAAPTSCDLAALMDGALRIAGGDIRRRGVVSRDYAPCPTVRGAAPGLSQVFLNLLLNAARALPAGGGGRVHVQVRPVGGEVEVSVRDSGHGICEADRGRIFEALFTAWPSEKGTGLGLHVSREIVSAHGGRIDFESRPGEGAVFRISLPAEQPTA